VTGNIWKLFTNVIPQGTKSVTFYTDCLNAIIFKCELKEFLKGSRSEHLRHSAQLSLQKADYFRAKRAAGGSPSCSVSNNSGPTTPATDRIEFLRN
jgi:hypothetical protein